MASYNDNDAHHNFSAYDLMNYWNNTPAGKAEERWKNSPAFKLQQLWLNSPAGQAEQRWLNSPAYKMQQRIMNQSVIQIPKSISNIPVSKANIQLLAAEKNSIALTRNLKNASAYSNMARLGNSSFIPPFASNMIVNDKIKKLLQSLPKNSLSSYLQRTISSHHVLNDFRVQSHVQSLNSLFGTDVGSHNVQQLKTLRTVTKQEFTEEFLTSIDKVLPNTRIQEDIDIQKQSTSLSEAANLIDWESIIEEAKSDAEDTGSQNKENITKRKDIFVPSLDLLTPRIFDYIAGLFHLTFDVYTETSDYVQYIANIIEIITAIFYAIKYFS